jgi:hypothetical protein
MKRSMLAVAGLVLTVAGASVAHAQATTASPAKPMSFGISAGLSLPNGDASDAWDTGFHVNGLADYRLSSLPLSIRGELGWQSLSGKSASFSDGTTSFSAKLANPNMITLTGNLLYHFPVAATTTVRPYLIGGLGMYNYKAGGSFSSTDFGSGSATERRTKFGLNGGIGTTFQLGTMSTFAEARFHNVFEEGGSIRMIPISFGIMF